MSDSEQPQESSEMPTVELEVGKIETLTFRSQDGAPSTEADGCEYGGKRVPQGFQICVKDGSGQGEVYVCRAGLFGKTGRRCRPS